MSLFFTFFTTRGGFLRIFAIIQVAVESYFASKTSTNHFASCYWQLLTTLKGYSIFLSIVRLATKLSTNSGVVYLSIAQFHNGVFGCFKAIVTVVVGNILFDYAVASNVTILDVNLALVLKKLAFACHFANRFVVFATTGEVNGVFEYFTNIVDI